MIMAGRGIGWRGFGLLALVLLAAMGGYIWWQGREPAVPSGFAGGNGRLEATEVDVATKIAGRVAELLPREGAQVKRGERVARIDMADVEAQRLQALAQVAQANLVVKDLRLQQRLLEVQGGAHQALRHRAAIQFGEALRLGQQPGQEIIGASQDDHLR